MKKYAEILIVVITFFTLVNTSDLWAGRLSMLTLFLVPTLFVTFVCLFVKLVYYIVLLFKEKFQDRWRIFVVVVMLFVLGLAIYRPDGLITYDYLYGYRVFGVSYSDDDLYMTIDLYLDENLNRNFVYRSYDFYLCTYSLTGKFDTQNDTIIRFLDVSPNREFYKFGIYNRNSATYPDKGRDLDMYLEEADTIPKYSFRVDYNRMYKR